MQLTHSWVLQVISVILLLLLLLLLCCYYLLKMEWTSSPYVFSIFSFKNDNSKAFPLKYIYFLSFLFFFENTYIIIISNKSNQLNCSSISCFYDLKEKKKEKDFALAETRTRIARVAGEHSTLRPPVLITFSCKERALVMIVSSFCLCLYLVQNTSTFILYFKATSLFQGGNGVFFVALVALVHF